VSKSSPSKQKPKKKEKKSSLPPFSRTVKAPHPIPLPLKYLHTYHKNGLNSNKPNSGLGRGTLTNGQWPRAAWHPPLHALLPRIGKTASRPLASLMCPSFQAQPLLPVLSRERVHRGKTGVLHNRPAPPGETALLTKNA